uniref:Transposase, MuDR, MULE transposase domain protein n=1 Tax=Tanacetum cinerariifolium TaxID=118510 RepID=A0A699HE61_TANCI|nr:transposase, MuDR, MULE transposase domain protein [Tanacetum cinerariifolium]
MLEWTQTIRLYHWLRVFRKAWYWKICKAYTVPEFERSISSIRALRPEACRKLEAARFEKWSRAHCPANRYNYMTSNCAESINALTKTVRKFPITMLMDYYRDLIQRCLGMTNCNRWEKAWFSKRTLKGTNQKLVYPLPDPKLWETPHDLQVVLPHALVKPQPGRPKNKDRITSQGEDSKINRCF